jgi:hypothetical protein
MNYQKHREDANLHYKLIGEYSDSGKTKKLEGKIILIQLII